MKGRHARQTLDGGLKMPLIEMRETGAHPAQGTTGDYSDVEHASRSAARQSKQADEAHFSAWCASMGFTEDLLSEYQVNREELKLLFGRDTAQSPIPWLRSHWLRPRSITFLPERLWLALTMRPAWVSETHSACWDPREWIWIRGITIPMVNPKGYALKLMMSNLWQGGVTGFKMTLHAILLISLGIQLRKVVDERPEDIGSTLQNGDSTTWKRLIYDATGTSARLFWPLIFAPTVIMAVTQMMLQTSRTLGRGRGRLLQLAAGLNQQHEQHSFWFNWIRPHLPMDKPSTQLITVADQLAFDGRLSLTPSYRQHCMHYLILAIRQTKGFRRLMALKELSGLIVGTHIDNLNPQRRPRGLLPDTPLSHLIMRMAAMQTMEGFVATEPQLRSERLYREWAKYHAWMAGRKSSVMNTGIYLTMHVLLTVYFFYGFKVVIDAIKAYLDCPDKTGVSMTGVADWSNDYTQPCFDAYLTFFRQIPGQPISFLVDIIDRVHFTETTIVLNLAYKGVNGAEIASILQALSRQGVHISSLNLTGNPLTHPEDYNAFMPELARHPNVETFILNDVGLESQDGATSSPGAAQALANWLPQLTHLKRLSIRSSRIGRIDVAGFEAIGHALSNCTQLEHLSLVIGFSAISSSRGTVAVLEALPHLHALKELELANCWIPNTILSVYTRSMASLHRLERFVFSKSWIQAFYDPDPDVSFFTLLPRLVALRELDFSGSTVGFSGPKGIAALMNATRHLPSLTTLRLPHTQLGLNHPGTGPALAQGLMRQVNPLQVIDLSGNSLSASISESVDTVLTQWGLPKLPVQLNNASDVQAFLRGLPPEQTDLELGDGPRNDESLSALFRGLAHGSITGLSLSGLRFPITEAGWQGLSNCSQLTRFEMSLFSNQLSYDIDFSSWASLLTALASLSHLETLSLSLTYMLEGDFDTIHMASLLSDTLRKLKRLRYVSLTNLGLGVSLNETTQLSDAFTAPPHLASLILNNNFGGYIEQEDNGFALLSRLGDMPSLTHLDISHGYLGMHPNATWALADFIATVDRPFYVNATQTFLGQHEEPAQALMIAIADNPLITASLIDAGFGSELWPPDVARLASLTYDPYLQAACSHLQCFGIQPTLPNLGNHTRINFESKSSNLEPLAAFTTTLTIGLLAILMCLGFGGLLALRVSPRTIHRPLSSRSLSRRTKATAPKPLMSSTSSPQPRTDMACRVGR